MSQDKRIIPIVPFLEKVFVLPSGELVQLMPHQKAILSHVFAPDKDGKLPYKQLVWSCSKKSGKSAISAMVAAWYAFSGICGQNGEIMFAANDYEQSQSRGYKELKRCIESNHILLESCKEVHGRYIQLKDGTIIQPLSSDYASAAGSNPNLSLFDELWAYTSEGARRLWDEMTPPPTRENAMRVVVTYAGFVGESELLEDIYKRVVHPEYLLDLGKYKNTETGEITQLPVYINGDSLVYWDHEPRMPWQTKAYYDSEINQPGFRLSAFRRIHRNEWVEAEEGMDMRFWDECIDLAKESQYFTPISATRELSIAVGIDASLVKDRAAVVTAFRRKGKVWQGPWKTWQPTKDEPLNFERTIEQFLLELNKKFFISIVTYDPWQMESSAQRLRDRGIPMVPLPQTQPNTIKMTENFLDKLIEKNLVILPDDDLRQEAMMVSIKEIPGRGRRFVKDNRNKKIDTLIAFSMAVWGATTSIPDYDETGGQIIKLGRRTRLAT